MGKQSEEATDDTQPALHSALAEEEELSVEDQLKIVEDEIFNKDKEGDGKQPDDETAESEESEETVGASGDEIPEEFKEAAQKEVDLQLRLQKLEMENEQLRAAATVADEEDEEETEYEYDVGDLDPALEAMREPLNAMGKLHVTEQKKLEQKVDALIDRLDKRDQQYAAQRVRDQYKISGPEEKAIGAWVKENGLIYHDQKSLSKVVELYRAEQELKAIKAGDKKAGKANANPRKRTANQTTVKQDLNDVGGNTFEDAWERSVQKTNKAVAAGTIR